MKGTLICKRLGGKRRSSQEEGRHRGRKQQLLLLLNPHLVRPLVRPPLTGASCMLVMHVLLPQYCHSSFDPSSHCRFALAVYHVESEMFTCTMPCNDVLSILLCEQSCVFIGMWCIGTSGCCRTCKHALRVIDECWPTMSASRRSAAILFVFMVWGYSSLYILL